MRNIREVLRLKWALGLSHREVAERTGLSVGSISGCVARAQEAGLSWPLPDSDDTALEARLYRQAVPDGSPGRPLPEMAAMHVELRRPGVTLDLLWQEYRAAEPDGYGYTQFCQYYRRWRDRQKLWMRQTHVGGDKLFVDYSGKRPGIVDRRTGEIVPVELFVAVLGASSWIYAEATFTQQGPDWIASHIRAYEKMDGVPRTNVPDCLKSGVTDPCWYEPVVQRTYEEMARHYGSTVLPARPKHPKDKAKAEVSVQVVQRWVLARIRNERFFCLDDLNARIHELVDELNHRPMRVYGASRQELFERLDRPNLLPLRLDRFIYAQWKRAKVNIDYHVELDKHYYSVSYQLAHQEVELRYTAGTVEVIHRGRRVASHRRSNVRGGHTTVPDHMPKAHRAQLEWTPSRLINWAAEIGPAAGEVVQTILRTRPHPEQGYRACLGVIRLGKRFGNDRLEAACRRGLDVGAPTLRSVRSILERRLEHAPLPGSEQIQMSIPLAHPNVRGSAYYQERIPPVALAGSTPAHRNVTVDG